MVVNENLEGRGNDAKPNRNDSQVLFERAGILPVSRTETRPAWEKRYSLKLLVTDTLIIIFAVLTALFIRYETSLEKLDLSEPFPLQYPDSYFLISLYLVLAWLISMSIGSTRDPKIFGLGPTEYKRVSNSTLFIFGLYGLLSFLFKAELGRGYILIALPLGLFLLLLSRWLWRKRLHSRRIKGFNTYRTLIVGQSDQAAHVIRKISRSKISGFLPVGVVTETGEGNLVGTSVPILGGFDQILTSLEKAKADTVVITNTDAISPNELRHLGWDLEAKGVQLIMAASLTDVAGPRIHMRPVSGLPLIHVDYPQFVGRKKFMKRLLDIFGALIGILIFSPLFLSLAIIVKCSSPGPIIFRQTRIGMHGKPFKMLKFRTMVEDAEDLLPSLLDHSDSNEVLFKLKNDPRIIKPGLWMRKYSLDEIPQFINVLKGDMSLVGPRPPLPTEVNQYEEWVLRRLLVTPGITGLWQVSGRSELSWDDSVRLDLYYVENWSIIADISIIWRTFRVIVKPQGAY